MDLDLVNNENKEIKVLILEDNEGDVRLIREVLKEISSLKLKLTHVETLSNALKAIRENEFELILLDLFLPDSVGLSTLTAIHEEVPNTPIIVLTGHSDKLMGTKAIQHGSQDYMVKEQIDSSLLERSIRYSIERNRLVTKIKNMSLVDELTGLYNRRGFLAIVSHQIKMAKRTKTEKYLLFADVDNMKWINDTLGHQQGDQALIDTANILKETFRDSDIIARIGGDEFIVFFTLGEDIDSPPMRFQSKIDVYNTTKNRSYMLSVSTGIARYNPESPIDIGDLIKNADKLMYTQKKAKKGKFPYLRS